MIKIFFTISFVFSVALFGYSVTKETPKVFKYKNKIPFGMNVKDVMNIETDKFISKGTNEQYKILILSYKTKIYNYEFETTYRFYKSKLFLIALDASQNIPENENAVLFYNIYNSMLSKYSICGSGRTNIEGLGLQEWYNFTNADALISLSRTETNSNDTNETLPSDQVKTHIHINYLFNSDMENKIITDYENEQREKL